MNKKLMHFSHHLQLCGVLLLLLSALRADGGLGFWLIPALTGMMLCLAGLGLSWLCSSEGQDFRSSTFGKQPPISALPPENPIPFPKAG